VRVNISYSCELEEVPNKVAEMVEEGSKSLCKDVLKHLNEVVGTLQYPEDITRIILAIDQLAKSRKALDATVETLADCDNILKGYVQALQRIAANETEQNLSNIMPSVDEIVSEIEAAEQAEDAKDREAKDGKKP